MDARKPMPSDWNDLRQSWVRAVGLVRIKGPEAVRRRRAQLEL
jgi:hypothetical protein